MPLFKDLDEVIEQQHKLTEAWVVIAHYEYLETDVYGIFNSADEGIRFVGLEWADGDEALRKGEAVVLKITPATAAGIL